MPAYYRTSVSDFICLREEDYLQRLMAGYESDRYHEFKMLQYEAWRGQYLCLKSALTSQELSRFNLPEWSILGEFPIPRRMGRIDNVLLIGDAVAVLEFKGESVDSAAVTQVTDYALDLAYFHRPSQGKAIYPIVVGGARSRRHERQATFPDDVKGVRVIAPGDLQLVISEIASRHGRSPQIRGRDWDEGDYFPVPTIIEAAVGMFHEMQVDDIAHADIEPKNLGRTVDAIRRIIVTAAEQHEKVAIFVTGVPGAGKTLAGLKLVHDNDIRNETKSEIAFLSGNGPLVNILRGALALERRRRKRMSAKLATRDPKTLIQSVYSFKNGEWLRSKPPVEHALVFDEAQRAWDEKRNVKKLKSDPSDPKSCSFSEPGLILHILNRHEDWAALVCLVGGGQEIHTGEAGLEEWGRALELHFDKWKIFASPNALHGDSSGTRLTLFGDRKSRAREVHVDEDLHLDNPTRQFRGKTIALWTESLLSGDSMSASSTLRNSAEYPVAITRSIATAKDWLKTRRSRFRTLWIGSVFGCKAT